jgi:hypothetical protein
MHPDKRLTVCACPIKLPASAKLMTKADQTTMRDLYPDAVDEVNPLFPQGRGKPMQTSVWFNLNHAHDKTTQKSIEGINTYLGRTLLKSKSKQQGSISSSTYTAELHASRTASEEAMDLRHLLQSLGIKLDGPTLLFGDNKGSLQNVTDPSSPLNK